MSTNMLREMGKMMEKKIKCVHCEQEIIVDPKSIIASKCTCGKISLNNGIIIEGSQGIDWVDVSPQLLNE